MSNHLLKRLAIGFCGALILGSLAGIAAVQAQPSSQEPISKECDECHQIIRSHWEQSAHALAGEDPAFVRAWNEQDQDPGCMACHSTGFNDQTGLWETEGVACVVCHTPFEPNHPEEIMPTDVSSRSCGDCHIDTFAEWQTSVHGAEGLTCVRCHNSHSAGLKKEDVQELCQACHNEQVHFFSYTTHFEEGLLCTDCHLRVEEGEMGEGHGERRHTFSVDLQTCTECHGEGLHYPLSTNSNEIEYAPLQSGLGFPADDELVFPEPNPVNPMGFAVLAGLIGMAFGMVLAPWLEAWYRRNS